MGRLLLRKPYRGAQDNSFVGERESSFVKDMNQGVGSMASFLVIGCF